MKFHQICTLRGLLLKIYKTSTKKVQRSYVSWHWRVMQNLKKKQFLVSKMTRIWWILIGALKSLKNLHFDWSLSCKVHNVWPKKVQRSYLSRHWKVMQNLKKSLENLHFNGLLLTKVYNVWFKKYRGAIFHDTRVWCKIWRKTDLWFGTWHEKFGKCSPEHTKFSNLRLSLDPFIQSRKCMSLRFTG